MVVPLEYFSQRKRLLSNDNLLQSLLRISEEISSLEPLKFLLKRYTTSMIRKSQLLYVLFEELLRNPVSLYPNSTILCFEEIYIVMHRIMTLIQDCSTCSKMWLLIRIESISTNFNSLNVELSTLLDILSGKELNLNQDCLELLGLIKNQCLSSKKPLLDSHDKFLKSQVLTLLDDIKREIIPDTSLLNNIFKNLCLHDSTSCKDEIESLEDEVHNQTEENFKAEIISLIGLVRYAKCVIFGESPPGSTSRRRKTVAEVNIPADFKCPISLELMRDPVVVSTGQTYDNSSITTWIESGHNTCPKTGQTLAHTELIPNLALKNLIAMWCREQRINFESTEIKVKIGVVNKTALEATKMTVLFLVNKLSVTKSTDSINRVVHELRVLAKTDSDCRACIVEAGALPLLVRVLGSENPNPSLEVNVVTTILNLSILEANKTRIMEIDGVLNGVIEVLRSGSTWEAKGNAAATLFSLGGVHAYRKILGRKTPVVKGLVDLAREGPTSCKKDAMVAIMNLAGDRDAAGKLIECGVVDMVAELIRRMPEEATMILEVVVKRGGLMAIAASYILIPNLATILREGSDRARESVAATLVNICRKGGSEMVAELAAVRGIERLVWEIMGMGTGRAKRKAATLLRILRRWAAGIDNDATSTYSSSSVYMSSTRIILPG
ncbi:hypothetical protein Leryth_017218 [Lithospermum erythrorhizon]|nr:hypothetical protein Leryth_017218 [Lithospermum erythrorhizon]